MAKRAAANGWKQYRRRFKRHVDRFDIALGKFVGGFSHVESTVLRTLWILAKMRAPYAQAVLSGVRTEAAMGYINRIAEAERWSEDKKADWQRVSSQLGLINKLRNDILHHGVIMFGDVWVVTNKKVVHHPDRIREIHVTPEILDQATEDLYDIAMLLLLLTPGAAIVRGGKRRSMLRDLKRQPWRYKQPPQADAARMMDKTLRTQSRPPASSQA